MKFRDLVLSSLAGMLQQKLRTLLTLSGIVLGATLLFCSISGGIGVLGAVYERLSVGDRLLTVVVNSGIRSSGSKDEDAPAPKTRAERFAILKQLRESRKKPTPLVKLTLEKLEEFRAMPGVKEAHPDIGWTTRIAADVFDKESNRRLSTRVYGIPTRDSSFDQLIVTGRGLSDDSGREVIVRESFLFKMGLETDAEFEAIIGQSLSLLKTKTPYSNSNKKWFEQLSKGNEVRLSLLEDSELLLTPEQIEFLEAQWEGTRKSLEMSRLQEAVEDQSESLTIVGVFRTPTKDEVKAAPDLYFAYFNGIIVPVDTLTEYWSQIERPGSSLSVKLRTHDPESLKGVVEAIEEQGFRCNSLLEISQRIRSAVLLIAAIITAIAAGAFFIAAMGMTNTMVMNVMERRSEIGILKSVGARDRDIQRLFLFEGALVGLVGGLLGLALGAVLTEVADKYVRQYLEQQLNEPFMTQLFAYPLWLIVGTPLLAALVTTFASYVPARRAAKLDPVETLRTL